MSPRFAGVLTTPRQREGLAMGWAMPRTDSRGRTRYTAMYRDLSGRRRSCGTFATERKALYEAAQAEQKIAAGRVGDPRRGRTTLRAYVEGDWLPNHVMEAKTRENYVYLLNRYVLPELGDRRIGEILPLHVREWVLRLQDVLGARPPTIREAKVVLDAIFTTALNDQITALHAGKGVKTPPVAKKPKKIITSEQFDKIHAALGDQTMQLLVEVDIESGLRWGELTELRVKDFDAATGLLTVARAVVQLQSKDVPLDGRFVVKDYPKDKEWRQVQLPGPIATRLAKHIADSGKLTEDLIFTLPATDQPKRRHRPEALPDPETLGMTEPDELGRQYSHGTTTAYGRGRCRCRHCKDAVADYRAARRASGKDAPREPRVVASDGHIPASWFRRNVWNPALKATKIGVHITPHGMRHAHASWLLAGGADLQVVKERLGHGSITTTEKYLHTLPGAHDAALAALDTIRGRAAKADLADATPPQESKNELEAELAHLRAMVDQFRNLLAPASSTKDSDSER